MKSKIKTELQTRLLNLRKARGWRNMQLADALGISPRTLEGYMYEESKMPKPCLLLLERLEAENVNK